MMSWPTSLWVTSKAAEGHNMNCPNCKTVMESRLGEIDTVPVIISICLVCMASTCTLLGDATPIFEKVFMEMNRERDHEDKTTETEVFK